MAALPVLAYHWVDDDTAGPYARWGVTPRAFERHMASLADRGWRTVPLEAVSGSLRGIAGRARTFALTFDDGYRDIETRVLPVLERHGFEATVFVPTDLVGGLSRWDAADGAPARELLDWETVKRLDGGPIRFGSHTCTHRRLTGLVDDELEREVVESRERLEAELRRPVRTFSYPYGDLDGRADAVVRSAGYAVAVTSMPGLNRASRDPLRLRRVSVGLHDDVRALLFKMATGHEPRTLVSALVGRQSGAPGNGWWPRW